jgi:hypothetical protein
VQSEGAKEAVQAKRSRAEPWARSMRRFRMVKVDPQKLGGMFLCSECAAFIAPPAHGDTVTCSDCLEMYALDRAV